MTSLVGRLDFVDSHVHFWDLKHPNLTYGWLAPEEVHPILGDIDGMKSVRFDARHLWSEARFAGLTKVVHIQAAVGTPDPVEETRWLTEMAADLPFPQAIVGHVDLAERDARAVMERHLESPIFRGVRDFSTARYLADPSSSPHFEAGFAMLAEHSLVADVDCAWEDMAAGRRLAESHPDVTIVLEHIGYPRSRDPEYFANWQDGISELSKAPNVHCKISGLGMNDPQFTVESLRPWVEHCIQSFGPARCLFGSNWPVDRLFSSYDAIIAAYTECISGYEESEQVSMFSGNASALYRI